MYLDWPNLLTGHCNALIGCLLLRRDIYEQLSSLHCWSSCWWRAHGMVITVFHPLCPLFDPTKCVETIHYDHPELRFDWDLKERSLVSSCWPHTDHLISDQLSWNLPLWPLWLSRSLHTSWCSQTPFRRGPSKVLWGIQLRPIIVQTHTAWWPKTQVIAHSMTATLPLNLLIKFQLLKLGLP